MCRYLTSLANHAHTPSSYLPLSTYSRSLQPLCTTVNHRQLTSTFICPGMPPHSLHYHNAFLIYLPLSHHRQVTSLPTHAPPLTLFFTPPPLCITYLALDSLTPAYCYAHQPPSLFVHLHKTILQRWWSPRRAVYYLLNVRCFWFGCC